jgi:hypothetical protein
LETTVKYNNFPQKYHYLFESLFCGTSTANCQGKVYNILSRVGVQQASKTKDVYFVPLLTVLILSDDMYCESEVM